MSNAISSLVFAYRNVNKATREENPEYGRAPVAVAQGIKVLDAVTKYNKALAHGADATISLFNDLAKESKAVDYAVKGVKWGVKNVNPMICASGVVKVAMSDDKTSTAIKETCALTSMFAGEKIAKTILPKLIKSNTRFGLIARGLLFVCASIGSYSAGEHLSKDFCTRLNTNPKNNSGKIDQKA